MHYVVHCLDHADSSEKRLEHYEAHKKYLLSSSLKTIISGPLLATDGVTMVGSCFILEADNISEVSTFNKNDPFSMANIWKTVSIHAFNKRVDNR